MGFLIIRPHVGAGTGTLKNSMKCLWRWDPDRRSNFSSPAHLCALPVSLTKDYGHFLRKGLNHTVQPNRTLYKDTSYQR